MRSDVTGFALATLAGLGMLFIVMPRLPVADTFVALVRVPPTLRSNRVLPVSVGVGVAVFGASLFGVGPVALTAGVAGGYATSRFVRQVKARRDALAEELWPPLLDTVRVDLAVRAIPLGDALFQAARRLDLPARERFAAAERQWQNTLDIAAALQVLKVRCDDATTDVVCASLATIATLPNVTAQQRLSVLSHDVRTRVRQAKDAEATLAGARFARRFVVIVPAGMAIVGSFVGDGRAAYQSVTGQATVMLALVVMAGCWVWAGRLLRVPAPPRVFRDGSGVS